MSVLSVPTLDNLSMSAKSKVVIITGAASGIGFATARLFVESGAYVVIADRDENLGSKAAVEIGHGCTFTKCDVTSWQEQLHLFTSTYSTYGTIDVVVCNAGIDPEIIFAAAPTQKGVRDARNQVRFNFLADELDDGNGLLKCPLNTVMDVNVTGVIYGVKLSAHFMSKTGGGRIVIIGSAASYVPVPEQSIYCTSKHAVLGLVRATSKRAEFLEKNIAISMVAPWLTTTPMTSEVDTALTESALASSGADVGLAAVFLATSSWEKVNGKSIWVQGQTYTEVEEEISECHHKMIKTIH